MQLINKSTNCLYLDSSSDSKTIFICKIEKDGEKDGKCFVHGIQECYAAVSYSSYAGYSQRYPASADPIDQLRAQSSHQ